MPALIWYRRDLRTEDHPALANAAAHAAAQNSEVWTLHTPGSFPDISELQQAAHHNALAQLHQALGEGTLQTLDGEPATAVLDYVKALKELLENSAGATAGRVADGEPWLTVHATEDYTPIGKHEQAELAEELTKLGAKLILTGSNYLVAPGSIRTDSGGNYKVYTPYSNRWFEYPWPAPMDTKVENYQVNATVGRTIAAQVPNLGLPPKGGEISAPLHQLTAQEKQALTEALSSQAKTAETRNGVPRKNRAEALKTKGDKYQYQLAPNEETTITREGKTLWTTQVGQEYAKARLEDFINQGLADYATARDHLAEDGTSRLSIQLTYGTIHPRTIIRTIETHPENQNVPDKDRWTYAKELAWREFYADYLDARPETGWENVNPKFENFEWDYNEESYEAWKNGQTGYPVVDAAMHQLNETGWMHNRARMIVASFLTKDLHLPWQWGAQYFLANLVDEDYASNQHGWQWCAGTGTDASPYFRIFNPYTQSERYDETGKYLAKWVPALAEAKDKLGPKPTKKALKGLHQANPQPAGYPAPIVNHKEEREDALARYEAIK
ncbi:hypothetical protein BSR29_07590 [Boudabousia liubingyangii]|uniref:Photolyase/cryptochrome alpha/beta domain-containing protein n=1 Tax=Boudabousia liubingyangii TaxID=1921764 RepID=A0A1Q5PKC2_9ACTO|nr:deoxyribodipyrimidine photo-lyase [Boudabousia liubingyangii]OKL46668.1 hypothetical protein BSR29_07590 [Boudabousia liubingyangii]